MAFFTNSLGLVKQLVGENPTTWGSVLNTQFIDMVDEAIAGLATINVTSADQTLTLEDGVSSDARAMILEVTGSPPAARTLSVPTQNKIYVVHNGTGQDLTVKTTSGTGVTLDAGDRVLVVVNEALDQVFLVAVGEQVVAQGPDEFTTIAMTMQNGLVGDTNPEYLSYSEGSLTTVRTVGFNVVVTGTDFVVQRNAGTFPAQILGQDRPMIISENGTPVYAYAVLSSNQIEFFKADGSAWVTNSQRIVYSHDWVYSTVLV